MIVSGVVIFLGVLFLAFEPIGGICIIFLGMGAIAFISATLKKSYKNKYKSTIVSEVLNKMFEVNVYNPAQGYEKDYVESTHLIPIGNRYSSDDYIKARYHGVEFERSDVCMQNVQSTGKTTTVVTYFQGSWNTFTFNKSVSTFLVIKEKEFLNNSKPGGIFSDAPKTSKVLFEDIEFNNKFVVYAQNEHDAFYILSPVFIEKIKQLEFEHDGRLIIGIIDNKIHILLDNRQNILEPSIIDDISESDYAKIENELKTVIDIMKSLDFIE